jgi:hypothetical protein
VTDTRPRHKYVLPDDRVIPVIRDHGEDPPPMISFEVSPDDPLWPRGQRVSGSSRRFVLASLVQGL